MFYVPRGMTGVYKQERRERAAREKSLCKEDEIGSWEGLRRLPTSVKRAAANKG